MQTHRLAFDRRVIEADADLVKNAKDDRDTSYSLLYQMSRLTHDRGSLLHDDRADSLSMAIAWFQEQAAQDQKKTARSRHREWLEAQFADKQGYMLLTPDRLAMGMTVDQARQSEAKSVNGDNNWI